MDFLYFVSEKADTVGLLQRIGKYVDDGATNRELPRGRYEIDLLETFFQELRLQFQIVDVFAAFDGEEGILQFLFRRNFLLDGLRIRHYI